MSIFFLETVKISYGICFDLSFHRDRVMRTVNNLSVWREIECEISKHAAQFALCPVVKCSVTYDAVGVVGVKCIDYCRPVITALRLIEAPDIDYHLKYADRSAFEALKLGLPPGVEPVIVQGGLITDTTFSNLLFEDSTAGLFTPAKPLLCGTMRERLLAAGVVKPRDIAPVDLPLFRRVHLINAMNRPAELVTERIDTCIMV